MFEQRKNEPFPFVKVAAVVAVLYLIVAMISYRFRHPELTETQLLQDAPKAILFR